MINRKNILILAICSVLLTNSWIPEEKIFRNPSYLKSYQLYLKGNAFYNKYKFDDAINYYKKALKIFNKYPEPYYKLAEIFCNKKDYNAAERYLDLSEKYKNCFRNTSDLAKFYKINGKYHEHKERYAEALDNYDHYNSIISNNIIIGHKIGFLSYKMEQHDKALIYLKKFVSRERWNRKSRNIYNDEIRKSYMIIINIYMDKKEYSRSLKFLEELYYYFPEKDIKERIKILSNNIKYYE